MKKDVPRTCKWFYIGRRRKLFLDIRKDRIEESQHLGIFLPHLIENIFMGLEALFPMIFAKDVVDGAAQSVTAIPSFFDSIKFL